MGGKSGPTTMYVSSYSRHMCPDATDAAHRNSTEPKPARGWRERDRERERARERARASAREQERPYCQLAECVSLCCYVCRQSEGKGQDSALLHMCPHTTKREHCYMCVLILLYLLHVCSHTTICADRARARARGE